MNKIRVLRLLEYIYDDFETMERDMTKWNIPQKGSRRPSAHEVIHSAVLPPVLFEVEDEPTPTTEDNAVVNDRREVIGYATHWNPSTVTPAECIVQYTDGSADSAFFSELVFVNGSDKAREYLNAH